MSVIDRVAEFWTARRELLRWVAAGLGSAILANLAAWLWWPRMAPVASPVDRLLLAVQCCAAIGFVALLMMQSLWRITEAPAAEDPFANAESRRWRINQRVYTNTLEQALIFVPIYLALAIRMAPEQVYMLPALMTIWCAGRILFWTGFHRTLYARAIGMDWTTVTTMFAAAWFVVTLT